MDNRVTTDDIAQQSAKAIKLLLEWAKQEILAPSPNGIGKVSKTDRVDYSKSPEHAKLLKASEVAAILQVSKSNAYQLMQRGEVPIIRIGRSVRVRQIDLDAFIKHNNNG